jgi:SAM-dependent methyltransferase
MISRDNIEKYFSGLKLIGDDFNEEEIQQWYEQEKNAYVELIDSREKYSYKYHALNMACGFKILEKVKPKSIRVCVFGSAFGDELIPIKDKISNMVLIDSASTFCEKSRFDNVRMIIANSSGAIDCNSEAFDLITCLGVLHHIPNVSFVMSELYRCLAPNGILLVREPTTTMGDWRKRRKGVTKNERGIPSQIFHEIIVKAGFKIVEYSPCVFPPLSVFLQKLGLVPYNSKIIVSIDLFISKLFESNYKYHRTKLFEKFAPASAYYVCVKNK